MDVHTNRTTVGFPMVRKLGYFVLNMNVYIGKYEDLFEKYSYLFYTI